jgi:hypothetical protein
METPFSIRLEVVQSALQKKERQKKKTHIYGYMIVHKPPEMGWKVSG